MLGGNLNHGSGGMGWIDLIFTRPYSALFIFLISVCIVLISALILRCIINIDRLTALESEVRSYNTSLKEAKRRDDRVMLRKLRHQEVRLKQISASVSRQRMKSLMVTFIPFVLLSFVMSILYADKEVVLFPFEFPLRGSFSIWYMLTYFAAFLPLSKILRTSPELELRF